MLAVEFANDVNPVTADYVTDAIERAEEEGYDAVVILLDTPGGLDSVDARHHQAELESDGPGRRLRRTRRARARPRPASSSRMAADVAAMAPQTNIGSSTPIAVGGGDIPDGPASGRS